MLTHSAYWGMLTQEQKEIVLDRVAEAAAERFEIYMDTIEQATALRELKGVEAMHAYRNRSDEAWATIRHELPEEYDEEMAEWGRLETAQIRRRANQAAKQLEVEEE